jgi:hypothetical protein
VDDASGFVSFVRRKYGLPEKVGASQPRTRWLWTVFELAEAEPAYTALSLGIEGSVFRVTESAGRLGDRGMVADRFLKEAEEKAKAHPGWKSMYAGLTFLPQRYWHLPDLVEASIAVVDMIEVAIPSLTEEPEEETPAGGEEPATEGGDEGSEDTTKADRGRRGPTTDERLIELEKTEEGREFAETATEPELADRIGRTPGAFTNSYHFQNNLRPRRAERRATQQMANARRRFGSPKELRSRLRDEDQSAAREHFERLEDLDSAIDGGH